MARSLLSWPAGRLHATFGIGGEEPVTLIALRPADPAASPARDAAGDAAGSATVGIPDDGGLPHRAASAAPGTFAPLVEVRALGHGRFPGSHRYADTTIGARLRYYKMDLARALLWSGDRSRAVVELERAERTAPQLIRNHPIARATLRRIVYAERAALRERLRRMSVRFHLDE